MREHSDVATRALCGAGAVSGACLAGVVTLLLGGACLAYAFVVPGLFGAVAAAVVAAERLLCAARSSTTKAAVIWTCVAFGWIVVASSTLYAPLVHRARAAVVGCPARRREFGGPSLDETGGVEPRMGAVRALGCVRGGGGTSCNAFRRDRRPARAGRCSRLDRADGDRRGQAPAGWQVPS